MPHTKKGKKTAMIRARIEPDIKNDAEFILRQLGLKPTDAITIFYHQIILTRGIPFRIDLETDDIPENYKKIHSDDELRSMLNL